MGDRFYNERYPDRLDASREELRRFHDAVLTRAQEILDYCGGFDLRAPPAEVRALNVLYSLIVVSGLLQLPSRRGRPPGTLRRRASTAAPVLGFSDRATFDRTPGSECKNAWAAVIHRSTTHTSSAVFRLHDRASMQRPGVADVTLDGSYCAALGKALIGTARK